MIRQLDVFANPDSIEAPHRPYLVVLQSDLVSGLISTIVAPLVPRAEMMGARRLNPILIVEGEEYWLATHELFAIDARFLHRPIGNLASERDIIIAALDVLFTGI